MWFGAPFARSAVLSAVSVPSASQLVRAKLAEDAKQREEQQQQQMIEKGIS